MDDEALMVRVLVLVAAFFFASPAGAATFYTFAPVRTGTFVLDPSNITKTATTTTATVYYVDPSRMIEEYAVEFDCAEERALVHSHRMMRYDLTLLRSLKVGGAWEKPDPGMTIGISLRLTCDWPNLQTSSAIPGDAQSLPEFLSQTADRLRSRGSGPNIAIDRSTVGDCIFGKMPKQTAINALTSAGFGKAVGGDAEFRKQVALLGQQCTGRRSLGDSDPVVFAAISIYTRYGVIGRLSEKGAIRENQLLAAWHSAGAALRQPMLEMVALMLAPTSRADEITDEWREKTRTTVASLAASPEISAALATATHLNQEQKSLLLYQYYVAVAIGEKAEAALAGEPQLPAG